MNSRIYIIEAYENEGEPLHEHGRLFKFFGVAQAVSDGPWPWSAPKVEWTHRFYATVSGECFDFVTGELMRNTTEVFKEYLTKNVKAQEEEKYIKLLERAKRI